MKDKDKKILERAFDMAKTVKDSDYDPKTIVATLSDALLIFVSGRVVFLNLNRLLHTTSSLRICAASV